MKVIVKDGLKRFIETVLDSIIAFSDYFIIKKRVSLSETTMFFFSLSWTVWFLVKGVYISDEALPRSIWVTLFVTTTVAHFFSFLFNTLKGRAYISIIYAVIWCFLTIFSAYTGSVAPAVPTLAVFTFLSAFIAVRLLKENSTTVQ